MCVWNRERNSWEKERSYVNKGKKRDYLSMIMKVESWNLKVWNRGRESWEKRKKSKKIWDNFRDIYFAKYYGKGGGEMASRGKKMKLGVREKKWKRGKKKGGKLH